MDSKPFWASKTIWVNAGIAGAYAIVESLGAAIPAEYALYSSLVVNVVLRWLTSKKLSVN